MYYGMLRLRQAAASSIKQLTSCIYSLVNQYKATLRNDVKFATVYRRIYCSKFISYPYKSKCIRMLVIRAGIPKMHVRIANRDDPDQTASSIVAHVP